MTGAGLLTSPRLREAPSEAAACRDLRGQVARLERERTELACSTWPRTGLTAASAAGGAARLLSLGELESLRDALVDSLARTRRELGERLAAEEQNRRLIEAMLADPAAHPLGAGLARRHRRARLPRLARAPAFRPAGDARRLVAGRRFLRLSVTT